MDPSFIPIETVPSKTPFGLDQLRRSYKTALDAASAIAAAPNVGDADEVFPNMFLMPISTPESAESATRIDLTYQGCFGGAEDSPVLPDQKNEADDAVQSVSSSKLNTGQLLVSPATLQYYAPSSVLTYFSFGGPGTDLAPDPTSDPVPITLTCSDTTFAPTGPIQEQIAVLFMLQIVNTFKSTEVVPGQYWQNTSRKTKTYSPWIFAISAGTYIFLYAPGNGYTAGDTLTISSGGESATIVVDTVGAVLGGTGIETFHVTATTFTVAHSALMATGGTGTGAGFNVIILT